VKIIKCSRITNGVGLRSVLSLFAVLALLSAYGASAESATPAIRLIKPETSEARLQLLPDTERAFVAKMSANFYHFGAVSASDLKSPQTLTFQFSQSTQIARISSTPDFTIVPGGTCAEGRAYEALSTCQLLVAFTPRGAGHRLGQLAITHTASNAPSNFSLTGFAYVPVVSFVPSIITTVPATVSGTTGLLNGAVNIATDSGDNLYIADTLNGNVDLIDSSGALKPLATGYTSPLGITTDQFGEVYFTTPSTGTMYEIYGYGPVVRASGTGTASCPASSPCSLGSEGLGTPGTLSTDGYNNLFFVDSHQGAALVEAQPLPAQLIFLYDPFPYQTNPSSPIVADQNDNIYSLWTNGGECEIVRGSLSDAENSNVRFTKLIGGHICGFSGDGGQAGSAEMGAKVGQMAFDLAGNFYFSDTVNNRVRRVDAESGIIRTIAGKGTAGNAGDGKSATAATLNAPSGVAVDSQGQVYITNLSATTGTAEVIRKVGTTGTITFGSIVQGKPSTALTVNVANTGTSALTITRETITGTNAADFTIDPTSTSCDFTSGNYLYAGTSCQIGVVFKPSAVGTRTATLTLVDNTVNYENKVTLSGTGATAATVKFTSPGATPASGTSVKLAVTVTSAAGPAPTGKVNFRVDGALIGSGTIASGAASVSVGKLAVGTHHLVAAYVGDKYHPASQALKTITITQ
jgi:Bacterial Ig-like domain (group 3)